jgi:hypothetical protein
MIAIAACASKPAEQETQETFSTPESAAAQLVAALRAGDIARLDRILGPDGHDLVDSGDAVADKNVRSAFVARYDEKHSIETSKDGRAILYVGKLEWPMPIPMVRTSEVWRFDTEAGREEILNRRIGANELDAVQTCLAGIDAQREYVAADRDGDGILEYARKFRSSPDARDGLYWPTKAGEPLSPLGEFAARASAEGYVGAKPGEQRKPYHGYYYRILTAQGEHAEGGAYDYMAGDNMIGGCALVAWPAEYAVSGVMTFIVNHDGVVFEKDLGEDTDKIASTMPLYDPGPGWNRVKE